VNRTGPLSFVLCLAVLTAGCSSISTTHLKRNEDTCGWDTTHLHGIPITIDVPDKFRVEIVESQYFHAKSNRIVSNASDNKPVSTRKATVSVTLKKEIFTVDFVKPASGQLSTSVDLDPKSQYFTEINNKITDTTIDSIANAINTIGSSIQPLIGGKSSALVGDFTGVTEIPRTVAVGFFDVNDRHALEKIHAFLCQHINGNGCAPTCPAQPVVVGQMPDPASAMPNGNAPMPGGMMPNPVMMPVPVDRQR
jgi:hypothetical protein